MTLSIFSGATELVAAIKRKEMSSVELTRQYIQQIESRDDEINAVVVRDFERALAAAQSADAALAAGQDLGPLHGIPMTIKEAYNIAGLPTTWGIPELEHNIATEDAASVRALKQAGAHFLGKTNVPLGLGDFQSFNDIYGTTNNPWDVTRTPGGSSGGSAAALAAGFTALEAGSDIGGSIRNPAHFCGVYGHKPTHGVVPDEGHCLPGMVAPADLAVVGPMARSAQDLRLSMDLVAGADRFSRAGWQLQLPEPQQQQLKDFRVVVWADDEQAPVDQEIVARAHSLGDKLARLGATVSTVARPGINVAASTDTYNNLLWGALGASLTPEQQMQTKQAAAALAADDRSPAAQMTRYSVQDHALWLQHNNARYHQRLAWQAFFHDWDIVICPQMATTAFAHDHGDYTGRSLQVNNEAQDYFQQIFWAGLITVAHLPSTVFPTGPSSAGLPIGLQAVGAEYNDYTTIEFTRLLAQEFGGFVPPSSFS